MHLKKSRKLLNLWLYALDKGANIVLMRHGPRLISNDGDLSEKGKKLVIQYGEKVLVNLLDNRLKGLLLACSPKRRTADTLKLLFPFSCRQKYNRSELDDNTVSKFVQEQVDECHAGIGRWRGYHMPHTYYFLENFGGVDESNLHTIVAEKMKHRIKGLLSLGWSVIYCGHSPQIEVGCERLLKISLAEIGGFLNPLDSIHLKIENGIVEFVARVNPIIGYIDIESESFYH